MFVIFESNQFQSVAGPIHWSLNFDSGIQPRSIAGVLSGKVGLSLWVMEVLRPRTWLVARELLAILLGVRSPRCNLWMAKKDILIQKPLQRKTRKKCCQVLAQEVFWRWMGEGNQQRQRHLQFLRLVLAPLMLVAVTGNLRVPYGVMYEFLLLELRLRQRSLKCSLESSSAAVPHATFCLLAACNTSFLKSGGKKVMPWYGLILPWCFASRAEFEVHAFRHSFAIGRMPGRLRYLKICVWHGSSLIHQTEKWGEKGWGEELCRFTACSRLSWFIKWDSQHTIVVAEAGNLRLAALFSKRSR